MGQLFSPSSNPATLWHPTEWTPEVSVPNSPSNLTFAAGLTSVNISWKDNSVDETGFTIQLAENSGFLDPQTFFNGAGEDSLEVLGLETATTYWVRVRATKTGSDPSAWLSGSFTTESVVLPDPPLQPGVLELSATMTEITLNWGPQENETGFEVQIADNGGFLNSVLLARPANTEGLVWTEAEPNTTYWVRVRAYNDGGFSPWRGATVTTEPEIIPSPQPTLGQLPAGDSAFLSKEQLASLRATLDAEPVGDKGTLEIGWMVGRVRYRILAAVRVE